ncbi:DUF5131 family protein [Paenibacillus sp. FSL R7-0216]|uniref:DUF5131 family protein n=1 Tax=Paenibacillus sp. FSL R7-0216 TaxID=2921677 RepID=UPI0030DBA6FC
MLQRVEHLRETPVKIKLLSCEPHLGPILNLDLTGIYWVIIGGESGPKARPMKEELVCEIKDQCLEQNNAFFFKQWGGVQKFRIGRLLDGQAWDEYPDDTTLANKQN